MPGISDRGPQVLAVKDESKHLGHGGDGVEQTGGGAEAAGDHQHREEVNQGGSVRRLKMEGGEAKKQKLFQK